MKKLVVLDHGTQNVHIYIYDEKIWESPEDFTDEEGNYILDSNCEWMLIDSENLLIH